MNNSIFTIIVNAIKARVMPLVNKLAMLRSPSYIRTKVLAKIRNFFVKLLDVRPKHKKDYYTIGNWMVSKRLAFAIVIIIGTISILYLVFVRSAFGLIGNEDGIRTYRYTSLLLRMQKGTVRIKAKDGHIAYEGAVRSGYCKGQGKLMDKAGGLVYEGEFAKSMFEGSGVQYYPSGVVHYKGRFKENKYNGKGTLYRANSSKEYEGAFVSGVKEGEGKLYGVSGDLVYDGTFSADEIVYSTLVGKKTTEVAEAYKGSRIVYQASQSTVVELSDIGASYEIPADVANLDDQAEVKSLYVQSDHIMVGSSRCTNVRQLEAVFGAPIHRGESAVTLAEAVAINNLSRKANVYSGPVKMESTREMSDLVQVHSYSTDYKVYIYSFESGGLVYSFLTKDEKGNSFDLYFITQNKDAKAE